MKIPIFFHKASVPSIFHRKISIKIACLNGILGKLNAYYSNLSKYPIFKNFYFQHFQPSFQQVIVHKIEGFVRIIFMQYY